MSRTSVLRALSRLPGAAFPEASTALRAALSNHALPNLGQEAGLQGSTGFNGFNAQLRPSNPFSFASQMHTLTRKEEEHADGVLATMEVPKAVSALSLLPPKPKGLAASNRSMASAAGKHLAYGEAHPFHILPSSPWPFLACMATLQTTMGMSGWFHAMPTCGPIMYAGLLNTVAVAVAWWRDAYIESDLGMHTEVQKKNIINGVWLFIVSEASLFFGLLWSCVHTGMSPNVFVQMQWPPVGIDAIGWEGRALVMSAVLAASYYSANVAMVAKDPKVVMGALGTTVGLGGLFLADQYLEYSTAPFTITDSAYGTTFFVTTGFHGFHVLIGSLWLLSSLLNYARLPVKTTTTSMKGSVLYWHFVDIVWIAVYGIIYCAQL